MSLEACMYVHFFQCWKTYRLQRKVISPKHGDFEAVPPIGFEAGWVDPSNRNRTPPYYIARQQRSFSIFKVYHKQSTHKVYTKRLLEEKREG